VADEIQSGLTDRIKHLIAAVVQRDGIDLQLVSHDDPFHSAALRGEA
jgi:hypothetical protein